MFRQSRLAAIDKREDTFDLTQRSSSLLLGECFDADDEDNARICASITPDTVLYILFRGKSRTTDITQTNLTCRLCI